VSTHATSSEEQTREVAARLAGELAPGTVILLHGDLGAGKTAFVRGLAEGLGVAEDEVSSPTFTLVHEYRGGRLPLYHADLYRLPAGASLDELGLDEVAEEGVLAIEWPERLSRPVPGALDIRIAIAGDTDRHITIDDGDIPPSRRRPAPGCWTR
jgi:tRNA threonylcarbamoyladenosine biosynthesis protein TsaE